MPKGELLELNRDIGIIKYWRNNVESFGIVEYEPSVTSERLKHQPIGKDELDWSIDCSESTLGDQLSSHV